ncbi:MAG: phosphoenolpyruvate--protein phosphotransferase [Planctomycetota bacterium]|jgi:phosphotransferase system enzyme I (PtsI)|nr:phosphoenolpyruvate--protein phosphotransferase [Planctomycetota bacterium]
MSPRRGTDRFTRKGTEKTRASRRKHQFRGVAVVPGISMGRVHLKFRKTQVLSDRTITDEEIGRELQILGEAVRLSKEQLIVARERVAQEIGELEATIFDTHIAILEDRAFMAKIQAAVQRDHKPVEVVVSVVVEGYYQTMSMVEDEHLRERAADIRDIGLRLLDNVHNLKNQNKDLSEAIDREVPEGDVVFARELLPSDIATLERRHVAGVVTEAGSGRGHCAVMLRALNIPTVMGVEDLATVVRDGDFVIVDGSSGQVHVNPRKDVVDGYRAALKDFESYRNLLTSEVELPAHTTDEHYVKLMANISQASDVHQAKLYRMDGVGLYRTEFQLMARTHYPDEEDQYRVYRDVVEAVDGKPITIRTMDIGTDKNLDYLKLPEEENSALGRRSIRLAFDLEDFQLTQLRAILRASVHGEVRLMFPFITSVEDVRLAKRLLRQAQRQLESTGVPFDPDIPIGIMVEVPAAALSMDKFAREVQFFSVGTNDLVQYVCAADRNQSDVAPWYKGYNPGVLQLLKHIVETAKAYNRPLTVCGEMAGDPFYTMFLVGIGCDQLSMSAPQMPLVKKIIRSINLAGAQRLVERALQYSSTGQIRHLFQDTVEQILGRDLTAWTKKTD